MLRHDYNQTASDERCEWDFDFVDHPGPCRRLSAMRCVRRGDSKFHPGKGLPDFHGEERFRDSIISDDQRQSHRDLRGVG